MSIRRVAIAAAGLGLAVIVVVGLVQLGGSSGAPSAPKLTLAQMRSQLTASPAPLGALHAQADVLLGGGMPALTARLATLHGRPVVINKWASWCGPCRAEFGIFQRVSVKDGREVAFIGIDSGDSHHEAARFLKASPVSYPSYFDPSGSVGLAVSDSGFTPVTVFHGAHGGLFIHQGPYQSDAELERDIVRYGLDA
jgi:cytochrome c biogenesis protein CcmG, thiol:disulfide interchange protein DsbE